MHIIWIQQDINHVNFSEYQRNYSAAIAGKNKSYKIINCTYTFLQIYNIRMSCYLRSSHDGPHMQLLNSLLSIKIKLAVDR